jgi:hypothetical protein
VTTMKLAVVGAPVNESIYAILQPWALRNEGASG